MLRIDMRKIAKIGSNVKDLKDGFEGRNVYLNEGKCGSHSKAIHCRIYRTKVAFTLWDRKQ